MMGDLRPAIVKLWQDGKRKCEISRLLDVPESTVRDAIKRFEETGSNKDRARSGRPTTANILENRQKIEDKICHCQGHEEGHFHSKTDSVRKLGRELGISKSKVHGMMQEVFELKSRKTVEGHQLDQNAKDKRLIRCKRLAHRFAAGRYRNILFTDEKWVNIEQAHNSQNDRIWSKSPLPPEVKIVERRQKPQQIMVWAGVTWDTKTPLIFVPQGVKVNGNEYRQMLETKVLPWAKENLGEDWTFQQDGAGGHRAEETQNWIAENFPDFIKVDIHWTRPVGDWPPNSPDLAVMDYFVWPYLESQACSRPHNSVTALKASLVEEWGNISQEMIQNAIDEFPKRLRKCIAANGGHFE